MDVASIVYDVALIITSYSMALLAADNLHLPCRWAVVWTAGVASVVWRTFRVVHTFHRKSVPPDHFLFKHDLYLSSLCTLCAFFMTPRGREFIGLALVIFAAGFALDGQGWRCSGHAVHALGHLTLVYVLYLLKQKGCCSRA